MSNTQGKEQASKSPSVHPNSGEEVMEGNQADQSGSFSLRILFLVIFVICASWLMISDVVPTILYLVGVKP